MWNCVDGCRQLDGAEAELVRGAIGMMTDQLVAEYRDGVDQYRYHIAWFDLWESDQRIWLLEQVTRSLLTSHPAPQRSAMLEATIDAVFQEIYDLVRVELSEGQDNGWRQSVARACGLSFRPHSDDPFVSDDSATMDESLAGVNKTLFWGRWISTIAERITGPTTYDRAEKVRDGDIEKTRQFLIDRGVDAQFLEAIPPLRSVRQTQASIDQIQSIVFVDR